MAEFSELYNKDKAGQAKLLKAKFSVRYSSSSSDIIA